MGRPSPNIQAPQRRPQKNQHQAGALGRGAASPACSQTPLGPAWPGLEESLRRVAAGRKHGGFFLEDEQRLQAWVGPLHRPSSNQCPRHGMGPWKPHGSLEAADGVLQ